jgi:hypothetical protein
LNIAFSIFPPDDRVVVVRLEELLNIVCSCFDSLKSFLAKEMRYVSLDGGDSGGGKMVPENPKR